LGQVVRMPKKGVTLGKAVDAFVSQPDLAPTTERSYRQTLAAVVDALDPELMDAGSDRRRGSDRRDTGFSSLLVLLSSCSGTACQAGLWDSFGGSFALLSGCSHRGPSAKQTAGP